MLDRFDTGMCDTSTSNAVALAANRHFHTNKPSSVIRKDGGATLFVDSIGYALSSETVEWLDSCLSGLPVRPIQIALTSTDVVRIYPKTKRKKESIAA